MNSLVTPRDLENIYILCTSKILIMPVTGRPPFIFISFKISIFIMIFLAYSDKKKKKYKIKKIFFFYGHFPGVKL